MKFNAKAIFEQGGIKCRYDCAGEDGSPVTCQARAAFVTESLVEALRAKDQNGDIPEAGDGDPELVFGMIAVAFQRPDKTTGSLLIPPGKTANLTMLVGGAAIGMSGANLLTLREAMVSHSRTGGALNEDQKKALAAIQEVFGMVRSAPDPERFPDDLIAQAYHAAMIDEFGEHELPIPRENYARSSRATLLKARIAMLDPKSKSGLSSASPLKEVLKSSGIDISGNGISVKTSAPEGLTEEAIRMSLAGNKDMSKLISGITATPVMGISAAMVSLNDREQLRTLKARRKLSGTWVDHIGLEISKALPKGRGAGCDMFSIDGRDILLVADGVSVRNDAVFLYSWPTADRIPVMDVSGKKMMNISVEEAPEPIEIDALRQELATLSALQSSDDPRDAERGRFDH